MQDILRLSVNKQTPPISSSAGQVAYAKVSNKEVRAVVENCLDHCGVASICHVPLILQYQQQLAVGQEAPPSPWRN